MVVCHDENETMVKMTVKIFTKGQIIYKGDCVLI